MPFHLNAGRGAIGRAALAAATLAGFTTLAFAQAGGPEYFRIEGLKKDDNVNVRRAPNADAKIVGKISKDADGIKNLGCKGGLTEKQWDKASEKRKKAAERERWCEVSFNDVKGWVSGRFLVESAAPQAAAPPEPQPAPQAQTPQPAPAPEPQATKPSFDCTKAEKVAENYVCKDQELADLDLEVARLYVLASEALNAMPGFETLLDTQRTWLAQRNTCFDRDCVAEMYVRRAHQLRAAYADARKQDAKSISIGPMIVRCPELPVPVAVTFLNSDPGYVYLEWTDRFLVLPHVPAGSGTRYEGSFASFHAQDNDAIVQLPNGAEMKCKLERAG